MHEVPCGPKLTGADDRRHECRLLDGGRRFRCLDRLAGAARTRKKMFYLLSHGGPSDAFWLDWNAGAKGLRAAQR